ncbi:MAG: hypothetical protein IJS14_00190 [Lentisphaeria bacterium]|nr:hypothetical protein [Lentisphaeria bacterium]
MPLEKRLRKLLSATEDVAEEDKIYLEKAVGEALMTPLRNPSDPNRAAEKGLLRDGRVPHADGFMDWAGLKGKNLYADYEFLYGRHWRDFEDQEHARAAVELVLSKPEQVQDIGRGKNASFVGLDEISGAIYRIEIEKEIKGGSNHIRSVFEITPEQYEKIKLEPPRVLQPSQTDMETSDQNARTISRFLRYDTAKRAKVKADSKENQKNYGMDRTDLSDGSDAERDNGREDSGVKLSVSASVDEAEAATEDLFRSEKDGVFSRVASAFRFWRAPAKGEKKDISSGAAVLKNAYYQGLDVPTFGRIVEQAVQMDGHKCEAENLIYGGASGRNLQEEFASWQLHHKAEYAKLNDYLIQTDIDRKSDYTCKIREVRDGKHSTWQIIHGGKVIDVRTEENNALEAAFQYEKNGLMRIMTEQRFFALLRRFRPTDIRFDPFPLSQPGNGKILFDHRKRRPSNGIGNMSATGMFRG